MTKIFIEGFILQASLILALGAQNLFVIDVGLKRNYHILAASICAICDFILILLGVLGVSALLISSLKFKVLMGMTGSFFLLYYAVLKFKESLSVSGSKFSSDKKIHTRKKIALTTLGFTLLNPHVYIDTFFLIGGYSTRYNFQNQRIVLGLGAGMFSACWFYFLAIFSSRFSIVLTKEKNLRIISFISSLILFYLTYKLGRESITNLQDYLKFKN